MTDVCQKRALLRQDLMLFHDVASCVHTIRDPQEMLCVIFKKIRTAFRIEGASLALHDPDSKTFYFIHTVEEKAHTASAEPIFFRDHLGVAGWVLKNRKAVIIADAAKDDRVYRGLHQSGEFISRSMICAPLSTPPQKILGVLYAMNKSEGRFCAKESYLLETIASTVAVALQNARSYGDLQFNAQCLESENDKLKRKAQSRFRLRGMIGESHVMRNVYHLMEKVAATTTSVLIQGETGTGKDLIAKIIHYNSPLREGPFIAENCSALSEGLLESELFGHECGAFTGAVRAKKGLFEMAAGGTLFLDEIGEMPAVMQVKLLRVLQREPFRRVGGTESIRCNVRFIAATNRNLWQEVEKGRFREDLYYRVNVFLISPPPLRERREDIPKLVNYFLKKSGRKLKRQGVRISASALNLLTRYDWPGNIRELENEIERALTLVGKNHIINDVELSPRIIAGSPNLRLDLDKPRSLRAVTATLERQMIREALLKTNGNRTQAARHLGLTRQGLLNKIGRYQIEL